MSNTPAPEPVDEQATHRRLAVDLFNFAWTMLDKPERSQADNDAMLHAAYTSLYHWQQCGTAVNLARGEWQISRVYATLGQVDQAGYHARRCLEVCQQHGIGDFDLAYAYEALARTAHIAHDQVAMQKWLALAHAAGEHIAEEDDRKLFEQDLATLQGVFK